MKKVQAAIRKSLKEVALGEPLQNDGITIFPILGAEGDEPLFILSSPAIQAGSVEVTEVDEMGQVPELLVINHGTKPVLFPEGEILIGAKQNRVVNLTILVPANRKFRLPVSCVEEGRWSFSSRRFRSGSQATPEIRAAKQRGVLRSRHETGEARSDQGEVWEEVADFLMAAECPSPTASLSEGIEKLKKKRRAESKPIELPPQTRGIVVVRGDQVVGMDVFDSPTTFEHVKERILGAYLLGPEGEGTKGESGGSARAKAFIQTVARAAHPAETPIGLGTQIEIEEGPLVGTGLWYKGTLCHLAAFEG